MANHQLDTPWTDARVEELRRLWSLGYSATQIADDLGEITRSGVLGKVHRLGLARHGSKEFKPGPPRPRKPIMRRAVYIAPPPNPEPPPPPKPSPPAAPKPRRLTLMQLAEHHCRWPVEGPPGFRFCGARRQSGDPYCRYHLDKAFAKPRGPR